MWKEALGIALMVFAAIIAATSIVLAVLEYQAPGLIRACLSFAVRKILRRGRKPAEYPAGADDPTNALPYCPHGCEANALLPVEVFQNPYEAEDELRTFRRVVRTKCAHVGEFGQPVHCHDVRELHWWERNWIVYGVLALIRLRLSAASCPEYVRGVLADHLHPVPGPARQNVYFVNGIYTNRKSASRQRQHIEEYLGHGSDVRLIHNRIELRLDPCQLAHDYAWGIRNSPATTPFVSQPALAAYALLLDGYRRNAEIAFVGFSGGALQVAMAIRAFRTVAGHHRYLRTKVRFVAPASLIHRSSYLYFRSILAHFDPHVDRHDPFARAFAGDAYTFDDGRTVDLGTPEWREEVNIGIWTKVGAELLIHEEVATYHSVENNYLRILPWTTPGEDEEYTDRHDCRHVFGDPPPSDRELPFAASAVAAKQKLALTESAKKATTKKKATTAKRPAATKKTTSAGKKSTTSGAGAKGSKATKRAGGKPNAS